MRAPDGFYTNSLCLIMNLATIGVLTYSLKKIWNKIGSKEILLTGAVGAFCFAIQIASLEVTCGCGGKCSCGCSFHFVGGILASILLGPFLAIVAITIIFFIQAFVFQAGGIIAIGSNLLPIYCISILGGYYIYSLLKNLVTEPYGNYISAFLSVWFTSLVNGLTICMMLSLSGIENFSITCPIIGSHAYYGIIEGLLTLLLLVLINMIISEKIRYGKISTKAVRRISYTLLCLAIVISIFIFPLASQSTAENKKLVLDRPRHNLKNIIIPYQAPIPDYHFPKIKAHEASHIFAGVFGIMATFVFLLLISYLISQRNIIKDG